MKICPNCGKEFSPFHKSSVYCSHACYLEFSNKRKRKEKQEKTCVVCGSLFTPHRKDVLYCSDECKKKAYAYKRDTSEKECLFCGKKFIPKQTRNQLYCSNRCNNKSFYQRDKEKIKKRVREWEKAHLKGIPKGRQPREHKIIDGVDHALCSKCGEFKPVMEFFKKSSTVDRLTSQCKLCIKGYEIENYDRIKNYQNSYKTINREKLSEAKRRWESSEGEEYREQRREYWAKYREENRELISARFKDRNQREDVKQKNRCYLLRRRTREKDLPVEMTPADWVECLEYFDYKDAYTGKPMSKVSQDHIIPLTKGGGYVKNNIVPCENSVNKSKNNKDMEPWYRQQPYFSEKRLNKIKQWMGTL